MAKDVPVDTKTFWTNGYAIIRGVFAREEAEDMRRRASETLSHKGDLLSNPALRDVLLDRRIVSIATQILGAPPVYFGDSSCNTGDGLPGYHKDNADRNDPNGPDWRGTYPLIRFGLYLQDYSRLSGGLSVRARSHNAFSCSEGKPVYMATRPGDVAVWNLRTTHTGHSMRYRFPLPASIDAEKSHTVPWYVLARKATGDRIALFATIAADGPHLERYITYLKTRTYMVDMWKASAYDASAWDAVKGSGMSVRDVWNEIKELSLATNERHVDIPY